MFILAQHIRFLPNCFDRRHSVSLIYRINNRFFNIVFGKKRFQIGGCTIFFQSDAECFHFALLCFPCTKALRLIFDYLHNAYAVGFHKTLCASLTEPVDTGNDVCKNTWCFKIAHCIFFNLKLPRPISPIFSVLPFSDDFHNIFLFHIHQVPYDGNARRIIRISVFFRDGTVLCYFKRYDLESTVHTMKNAADSAFDLHNKCLLTNLLNLQQ